MRKIKFHHFVPLKNFWKTPLVTPVEKNFRRPWIWTLVLACSRQIYVGVSLHAHPVRGESHIQRHANRCNKGSSNNTKMVIYSTVQSRCYIININHTGIGVNRNISIDLQSRHFACQFQDADDRIQMGVHITFSLLHHKENDPCYGNSPKNALRWQQDFFHIVWKYMTYCNQQSLSRCITCHRCLQQSHAAKRLLPQLEVNLCCHVTVTQWRPISELSAPKFRNLPLQAM